MWGSPDLQTWSLVKHRRLCGQPHTVKKVEFHVVGLLQDFCQECHIPCTFPCPSCPQECECFLHIYCTRIGQYFLYTCTAIEIVTYHAPGWLQHRSVSMHQDGYSTDQLTCTRVATVQIIWYAPGQLPQKVACRSAIGITTCRHPSTFVIQKIL